MSMNKGPRQEYSQTPSPQGSSVLSPIHSISSLMQSIATQFDLAMGRPEQVEVDCAQLRRHLGDLSKAAAREPLLELAPLLSKKVGLIVVPVFGLLEDATAVSEHPWPLLEGMLAARDERLARRALDLTLQLVESRSLVVDMRAARFLADCVGADGSPLMDPTQLKKIARILSHLVPGGAEPADPPLALYLFERDLKLRRLAAHLLDLRGEPVPAMLGERILGRAEDLFLRPYLEYTRAGYMDLLCLMAERSTLAGAIGSFRRAEAVCGEAMLREAIAKLGWARLNLGLEVRQYVGISLGGSFPLLVSPEEAFLLESCGDARRVSDAFLFIAHGGMPVECREGTSEEDPVARFRSYNLAHAEALADLLDLAPLTRQKVERILDRMDRIVQDFLVLFSSSTKECAILPGIYQDLKHKILRELENEATQPQLSAELTRLVQMFEDPQTVGAVRTLHGLKRYLHQKGLRLGMRLVDTGRGTNRTVDLMVFSRSRPGCPVRRISYVDFEPQVKSKTTGALMPYPVTILVEGLSRQLLVGQEKFPDVKVFCYGNEVHYYLSFGNHPAFLRVDYSPPLQGGMIDLEYYGVSKYEMSLHPNTSLDAIRRLFRHFDFDVQSEQTRIHARYDKERALDLGAICAKAKALFCFVAYLMEVDWVIGNLELKAEAKEKVAAAWASFLSTWGSLPMAQFLSSDRRGILVKIEAGPTADREVVWSGEGRYYDRCSTPVSTDDIARIHAFLERQRLPADLSFGHDQHSPFGQLVLEREILLPLQAARKRGEVTLTPAGFRCCDPDLYRGRHETEIFAQMLTFPDETLLSAAGVALLVAPLERTLRFSTKGSLNGYDTQEARLSVLGEQIGIYALRDIDGIIRLAFFAHGGALYQRRERASDPWQSSWSWDSAELASLLRACNYLSPGLEPMLESAPEEAAKIRDGFRHPNPMWRPKPLPGERIVTGLTASPGRVVGTVLFGTGGRIPSDFDGVVLVAASMRPEDNAFLYRSAGIVCTGGGILSHAGLMALQFRKPALIISGEWMEDSEGTRALSYRTLEYREEESEVYGIRVSAFRDMQEREHRLHEGDLAVLDADDGILCVLGQDREALALHEDFQAFGEASRRLQHLTDEKSILIQRGRRLQARHQIEKLLSRLMDELLARHAVREILVGRTLAENVGAIEKAQYLSLLLRNPSVGETARDSLGQMVVALERRCRSLSERAAEQIPASPSAYEVLSLRLEVLRLVESVEKIASLLKECGLAHARLDLMSKWSVDASSRSRLKELRREYLSAIKRTVVSPGADSRLRHMLREVSRLDSVLGEVLEDRELLHGLVDRLAREDQATLCKNMHRRVLFPEDGGFELHPIIGWKAANLAEVQRLEGRNLVPPWFVVTHSAFEEALDLPLERLPEDLRRFQTGNSSLGEAIAAILVRPDLDYGQKSVFIRDLWGSVTLPAALAGEVIDAYRRLFSEATSASTPALVAIRSSAREEDAEIGARAGEFETFLFVCGDQALLEHLKRAWSGLWTERAIHNRIVLGCGSEPIGGGVVVQRVVFSRVSGVLQTGNASGGEQRQMVINAGLGLGEGVVSGTVAADQIVVAKESGRSKGALHFRYITADKREQVVYNKRGGLGTVRVETLYHQRYRPALEYVELCELVRTAADLEFAYGYPLDIEFAFEGTRLWILQARPIASYLFTVRETGEHHPLICLENNACS